MSAIYRVGGMSCEGCKRAVTTAIARRAPAARTQVDLAKGLVAVENGPSEAELRAAIEEAGFTYQGPAA